MSVAAAIVMMLLLTLVPHHHHEGGAACWIVEVCHTDGHVNDRHTAHHDDCHDDSRHHVFVAKQTVMQAHGGWSIAFLPADFWNTRTYNIIETAADNLPNRSIAHRTLRPAETVGRRGPPAVIG